MDFSSWAFGFICGAIFMIVVASSMGNGPGERYKNGQVDALTGKVVYELKEAPDGTRSWELVKSGNN